MPFGDLVLWGGQGTAGQLLDTVRLTPQEGAKWSFHRAFLWYRLTNDGPAKYRDRVPGGKNGSVQVNGCARFGARHDVRNVRSPRRNMTPAPATPRSRSVRPFLSAD